MKIKSSILTLLLFFSAYSFSQKISNIHFEQVGKKIHIYYDLKGSQAYNVQVFCSTNNGQTWGQPLQKVAGAVGENQKPGYNKKIIWNVLNELDKLTGEIVFRITAKNNRSKTKKAKTKNQLRIKKNWVGFKVGGSMTRSIYNNYSHSFFYNPIGYNLGFVYREVSKNAFAFQFEFLYENVPVLLNDSSFTIELHYNSIPILAQFHYGSSSLKYFFEFGIPLAFPYTDGINFDLGLIIGGGINMYFDNRNSLNLDVRYYHGLNNIIGDDFPLGSNNTLKKGTLTFSVAYLYGW